MVSRKYTKDYRLENVLDGHGRLVTRPVYCGSRYAFDADENALRRLRVTLTLLGVAWWAFFVAGLIPATGAMRNWYVSVPYFCGFLPSAFAVSSVYYIWRYTSRPPNAGFTREERDRVHERLKPCSFACIITASLSAVGEIYYLASGAQDYSGFPDIMVIICICVVTAVSGVTFVVSRYSKMHLLS